MRVSPVTGCCHSMNFYNLGGAHGHRTAKDQNEFEDWLAARGYESINIAITNAEQSKTRTYLEAAGWKTEKVGYLWISTISSSGLQKVNQRVWARQAEERKQALEKKRKLEAERLAMKASLKFSPGTTLDVYQGLIYRDDILRICNNRSPFIHRRDNFSELARIQKEIEDKYKIKTNDIGYMSTDMLRQHVYNKVYKARKNAGIL